MSRVVITGMGAFTPVGKSVETLFDSLRAGRHGMGLITRFDTADFKAKVAAEIRGYDPLDYLPKAEARKMDLFTQYAVIAAAEAMGDSGLEGKVNPERFGVYVGSGIGGMETFAAGAVTVEQQGPRKISPFIIPMMISNMAAGMISIRYGAAGPTLPVVTACATSTHAIGEAFRAIKHGYADAILAGGTEAAIHPLAMAGFQNAMALNNTDDPESASIPFDKRRNGFIMGEGAGVLVLEEYEHAVRRGANIYAEVVGYGNTADAHHMTAPHPEGAGAIRAIRLALEEGGYEEGMAVYVNAHGTSTPLNDKAETHALKAAFGEEAARKLRISSSKSMTGHMLGAAGAVEAIVSVMTLRTGIVTPTVGYQVPDEDCDLDVTPNVAVTAPCDFAISNSFGFGGHNAVVALKKI
ncbi:3-oxoacyl-(acyl-carrier-protein) synthase II [uncultured Eubacteriales bacterium]|uniref:3-oxoacyl-[acyl-carrier-protein] synthase 2 n=1 Tax=uncultured Eubacteriales bacterium TaxID=172733 RepID=A0A212KA20_9FIRM|nr:3-oxoacyl-(acyl-carrier-protein) synthase II [uncultured Eubacteriales bacterium]